MKKWLRGYLGVNDLVSNQQMLLGEQSALHRKVDRVLMQVTTITPGLGRVIAKLDARFAEDESNASPKRKAESERIGREAIKRLEAEALARAPYNIGRDD